MEGETAITKITLTRSEAAAYLGVHVNTVDRSDIPRVRIGARTLYRKETLDKYCAEMERIRRPRCRK